MAMAMEVHWQGQQWQLMRDMIELCVLHGRTEELRTSLLDAVAAAAALAAVRAKWERCQ